LKNSRNNYEYADAYKIRLKLQQIWKFHK